MITNTSSQSKIRFIFATILLDSIGVGIIIPVLPELIRKFNSDPSFVSTYFGYFISLYSLMQFLASPVLGVLSDRFGRRPILLISLLGAGLDYILMAFATNLSFLFLGRLISGVTGASATVASSYMADISTDQNRSANFGLIGAGWGLGFIIGPLLGGLLGSLYPSYPQAPFLLAAILSLLNFGFGYFILPESLPPHLRRQIDLKKLNPFVSIIKFLKPSINSSSRKLIWIFFLTHLAQQVYPSIWALYTGLKFQWSTFEIGLSLTFTGIVICLVEGGLTRILIPRIGERLAIHIGILFYIIGFPLFAFASTTWMIYIVMAFFSFSGIAHPALQALISEKVPVHEQGELQGSLISMLSLTAIIGPLIYTSAFEKFTTHENNYYLPDIPFLIATVFSFVAWLIFLKFRKQNLTIASTKNNIQDVDL